MKKTLILAVDRDDDFGKKADIGSPAVGRDANEKAALSLALVDPEDSDVNTILAALSMYDEMKADGYDVEIALICGDPKVGYRSDSIISQELEYVLDTVKPDRVILVSDGAEDEYIYPIVSSRAKIDSVRRVFVKQAPGVEGALYILMKMLQDDDKRKRFVTPFGIVLIVLGVFAVIPDFYNLISTGNIGHITGMMGGVLLLVLGVYSLSYAYKMLPRLRRWYAVLRNSIRRGNQRIPFTITAIVLFISGLVIGIRAALDVPEASTLYQLILFSTTVIWMWIFALLCYEGGKFIDLYLEQRRIRHSFLIAALTLFALAFILQGMLDIFALGLGFTPTNEIIIVMELMLGFTFAVIAGILQSAFNNIIEKHSVTMGT